MRKKSTFLRSFLLLFVLLVTSVTTIKAQEVTLVGFTSYDDATTSGNWIVSNTSTDSYVRIVKDDYIEMVNDFDFSLYDIVSISFVPRTYFTPVDSTDVLRVTMGGIKIFTKKCERNKSKETYTVLAAEFINDLTGIGKIKIDCPGASSSVGLGLYSFTVTGIKKQTELVLPVLDPAEGTQASPTDVEYGTIVTATCQTAGATLAVSIDGVASGNATVAIMKKNQLVSATATLGVAAPLITSGYYSAFITAPTFSLAAGDIALNSLLSFATTTAGVTVQYSTDGITYTPYDTPITIPTPVGESITYYAKAVADNGLESPVTEKTYAVKAVSTILESFEKVESSPTNSYREFSWTADDNTSWSTTDTRIDEEINGKAICIRTGTMTSATYTSGMGVLSFKYRLGFSGSGDLNVYVNDILKASFTVDSETVSTFTQKINIPGDVTLKLTSTDAGRPVIDDVTWTTYDGSDSPGMISREGDDYAMSGYWLPTDLQNLAGYVGEDALSAAGIDFTSAEIDVTAMALDFPTGINPNCLLKTTTAGRFTKNNVVEGDCANLQLTDKFPFDSSGDLTVTSGAYIRTYGDTDVSGWYSLYLPFALTQAEILAAGFTTVEQLTGFDAETNTLEFTAVTSTEANVPYIVLFESIDGGTPASYTGGELSIPIAGTVSTATGESVVTGARLVGTYEGMPAGTLTGKYVISADGTSFQKAGENVVLTAFRVYLELTTTPSAAPRQLSISSGGEGGTTGVSTLNATGIRVYGDQGKIVVESSAEVLINVYGVDGSCLRKVVAPVGTSSINGLSKGLYIVNRQKVVVK